MFTITIDKYDKTYPVVISDSWSYQGICGDFEDLRKLKNQINKILRENKKTLDNQH